MSKLGVSVYPSANCNIHIHVEIVYIIVVKEVLGTCAYVRFGSGCSARYAEYVKVVDDAFVYCKCQ
jgi:hypothetical protein